MTWPEKDVNVKYRINRNKKIYICAFIYYFLTRPFEPHQTYRLWMLLYLEQIVLCVIIRSLFIHKWAQMKWIKRVHSTCPFFTSLNFWWHQSFKSLGWFLLLSFEHKDYCWVIKVFNIYHALCTVSGNCAIFFSWDVYSGWTSKGVKQKGLVDSIAFLPCDTNNLISQSAKKN